MKREIIKTVNITCSKLPKDKTDIIFFNNGEVYIESWDERDPHKVIEVKVSPKHFEDIISAFHKAYYNNKRNWRLKK